MQQLNFNLLDTLAPPGLVNKNHEKEKMENMKTKQEAHKPHIVPPTFFQPSIVIPPSLLQQ
jgi:hypothetical protein